MSDEDRPHLVFSDVDETLITLKSMSDFPRYQLVRRRGTAGQEESERLMGLARRRAAHGVPRADTHGFHHSHYADESAAAITQPAGERFAAPSACARGFFTHPARRALAGHRAAGATLVPVSGSFPPLLHPPAREAGAGAILCTRRLTTQGHCTGEAAPPVTGEDEHAAVQRQPAARPEADPRDCYACGPRPADPPMPRLAGHPVTVGDAAGLREHLPAQTASVRI